MNNCIFCALITNGNITYANEHAVAFPDGFPLNPGHTLVVPRRHETDLFELPASERHAVWSLVDEVHADLAKQLHPDGFNVGLNVLEPGGQTIPHAHVHVIPRSTGDVPDPKGGVRWVIPSRAAYWLE
jgi:diadenosine tetraphosphate (Ap4A) HIT family hydrolase